MRFSAAQLEQIEKLKIELEIWLLKSVRTFCECHIFRSDCHGKRYICDSLGLRSG